MKTKKRKKQTETLAVTVGRALRRAGKTARLRYAGLCLA